jgi:inorganic pyrophosphatase
MMKQTFWIFFLLSPFFLFSCKNVGGKVDYNRIPAFSENGGVNMVVEIPAGTNHKIEFQKDREVFENDLENGQTRIIRFLPYPGNYGFIPSTRMDTERGGDGDALDILLIAEHLETGEVVETRPIAALRLSDRGEIDTKIIAVPTDPEKQLIQADNFVEFLLEYDSAKRIIEEWFLNYKGLGATELLGWEDESFAMQEINKWLIRTN